MEKSISSPRIYEVLAQWDREAAVWIAEADDVPGLVAEADSPNRLAEKLRILIPELLELNGVATGEPAGFHVRYSHEDSLPLAQRFYPHPANAVLGIPKRF